MPKKKKEKDNWVSRLKAGVKYHLSGKATTEEAAQMRREARLKRVNAKLAKAKGEPAKKKKSKKKKSTSRTKQVEERLGKAGIKKKKTKKMRGNY